MLVNSIPQGWVEVVRTERRAAKERICWSRHGNDDRTELKSSSFGRENKDAIVQCRASSSSQSGRVEVEGDATEIYCRALS